MAATAVLATSGSAQTQTTTLHFVSTPERGAGFAPKGAPHPGDRLGFGSKITGDDTGFGRGICTVLGKKGEGGLPCTIWVHLSRGTLALQGLLPERAHNTPIAVTGGTGAYNGARGTALVTEKQTGRVKLVQNRAITKTVLDLPVNAESERGLLSIALSPSFATDNFIYLYHTAALTQDGRQRCGHA